MLATSSVLRDKLKVVACIPAFNEERTIAGVVLRVKRFVDRLVVCDDGSGI
jgi:glycosyltransferase involved in cell wall biosynthesis